MMRLCACTVPSNNSMSSPRKRGSIHPPAQAVKWIPAFAGMTTVGVAAEGAFA